MDVGDRRFAGTAVPMVLLVVADLTGRAGTLAVEDLSAVSLDAARLEKVRAKLRPEASTAPTWEALRALAEVASPSVVVEALDVSLDDLRADLEDAPRLERSGLYIQVNSYNHAGMRPTGALVFGYDPRDTLEAALRIASLHAVPLLVPGDTPTAAIESATRLARGFVTRGFLASDDARDEDPGHALTFVLHRVAQLAVRVHERRIGDVRLATTDHDAVARVITEGLRTRLVPHALRDVVVRALRWVLPPDVTTRGGLSTCGLLEAEIAIAWDGPGGAVASASAVFTLRFGF
jgi:hypothetical protein